MKINWKKVESVALVTIRLFVGGLFIVFAIAKLMESPDEFQIAINSYRMLPQALVPAFGMLMVYAELIFGLLLFFGAFTRWSAAGVGLLLLSFIIAIGQAMARGLDLPDCGCAGSLHLGDTPQQVLFRDILMFIGMTWLVVRHRAMRWTLDQWFNQSQQHEKNSTKNREGDSR